MYYYLRIVPLILAGGALSAWQADRAPDPVFDVASVKSSGPASREKPARTIDPTLFSAHGYILRQVIMLAYGIPQSEPYRLTGGPAWIDNEAYDIDGHPRQPSERPEMLAMVQALFADRFSLKIHREIRPIAMNAVIVARGGPRFGPDFHEVRPGEPLMPPPAKQTADHLVFSGVPFQTFVDRLRLWMARDPVSNMNISPMDVTPLVNDTGLAGRYDIVFNLETHQDWSAALQSQLGLKLQPRNVPTEVIVIDTISKPLAN